MKVLGVIPARYAAQRFPGKPLALIHGKPMVQRVFEAARRALPRVVVATDDRRVFQFIRGLGGEALMTSAHCQSGTDRVAEAARKIKADLYLNIQGDEPLMSSRTIKRVLALHRKSFVTMGTAAAPLMAEGWKDPNTVKVLVNKAGEALYFSRAPLPFFRDGRSHEFLRGLFQKENRSGKAAGPVHKHLGIYSYTAAFLKRFVRWPQTFLEKAEKLEQLRALENGARIHMAFTPDDSVGVDRSQDVRRVEKILERREKLEARGETA
jgi:3-deoxy-manno-octulosonate cytidylyltransferase (CMP-KDO synthetase)